MAKLFNNKIFFLKQNASELKEKSEYSVTCTWMWSTYTYFKLTFHRNVVSSDVPECSCRNFWSLKM